MVYQILKSNFLFHHQHGGSIAIVTVAIKSGPEDHHWKCYQGAVINAEEKDDEEMEQKIAALGVKLEKHLACAYFPSLNPEHWIH